MKRMTDLQQRRLMGWVLVGAAAVVAFRAHTERDTATPWRWMLIVVAVIFALVGVQLVTAAKGRLSALIGGLVGAGMSTLAFCGALGHETLRGGIPFIPAAWNQAGGRLLFGFGGFATAVMAFYLVVRAIKPGRRE